MTEWKPLIYILVSKDPEETNTYVGKAGEGLFRYYTYLTDYYGGYHKVVEYVKAHGGWSNWKWIPVEYARPDTTSKGLSYMERYWIDFLNPSLNVSKRPILWPWERRKRHKNKKERCKRYKEKKARTLDLKDLEETKIMPQRPYKRHTVYEFLTQNPNIKYLGSTTLSEPNMDYYTHIPVVETRYLGVFQDAQDEEVGGRVMPRIMFYFMETDNYVLNKNALGLSYFKRDVEKFGDEETVLDIYERLVEDYRVS